MAIQKSKTTSTSHGKAHVSNKDGRSRWFWGSKYPEEANKHIFMEALILTSFLFIIATILFPLLGWEQRVVSSNGFTVDLNLVTYFLIGCIGGLAFSIKWLYHSVAKGWWHLDRRLWRFLSPILAGAYTIVILKIELLRWINVDDPTMATYGMAFIIGYFGDGISGVLTNIGRTIFGTVSG